MNGANVVTLTTDFGLRDWFVGSMRGVILSLYPKAQVVDITHEIAAGDVRAAAFALAVSYRCFPTGTVHVAVVDPGVGSDRPAVVVKTDAGFFVGPDNGVLSWALREETVHEVRRIENTAWMRQPVSRTFHGRDVFAPVAARIAMGMPWQQVGPVVAGFERLAWPEKSQVLYVDRFGNAITNIRTKPRCVTVGGRSVRVVDFYQQGARDEPVALMGSSGFLEIAINGGNAAAVLGLRVGTPVEVD
ncbi:MAG: SAM-dependent chlorinase/fluorinase [Verrucomicrobiae bacterium]|nr:SAM-dependent chlorinase/fluorinase [Verrucomicrobiae bacterium]